MSDQQISEVLKVSISEVRSLVQQHGPAISFSKLFSVQQYLSEQAELSAVLHYLIRKGEIAMTKNATGERLYHSTPRKGNSAKASKPSKPSRASGIPTAKAKPQPKPETVPEATPKETPKAEPEAAFASRLQSRVRTKLMTLKEWSQISDFHKQRNTEGRAKAVSKSYLSGTWLPTWGIVAAAELPDGQLCKVDGHTRDYLWQQQEIALPPGGRVTVHIFPVENLEEADRLYHSFNSSTGVKTAADYVYGELRSLDLLNQLQTPFLRGGLISEALRFATGLREIPDMVQICKDAILLFDQISPKKHLFRSGIIGAALLTIRADGQEAIDRFWLPYNDRVFERTGQKFNGPGALEDRARTLTSARVYGGRDIETSLLQYALSIYEKSLRSERFHVARIVSMEEMILTMRNLPSAALFANERGISYGSKPGTR